MLFGGPLINKKELVNLLKKHEGIRLKPYKDSVGKVTLGIGRNIESMGITAEEAEFLLQNDIQRCYDEAVVNFKWFDELDETRQDVILSMIFNLGLPSFLGFKKMIQAIENKDFESASKEMLDSKWSSQVGKRAYELSEMMKAGVYL